MSNVTIVTDTMSCLPDNLYKEYGIFVSPLSLNINGKGYRDKEDMTSEQFWKMFPSIKDFTTSTVSPGDMADLFRKAAKKTDSIACIVVSAALTGVYSAAGQAKDLVKSEFPGLEITVVDSKTAAGAEGFAVLEAARAAAAGKDLAEVVTVAEDVARRSSLLVAM
ncbi:MAG: DegV family EDD domain-containing protein [Chloroflexi bacterium]|nr:DegV family EDD domain-containing protein [Chloroflexota bacterium]